MALGIVTKNLGGGDDSWMGSRHGVAQAATGTLDASAFTVTNNIVKSGYPVAKNATSGLLEPYGTGDTLYGFVIGDYDISNGDEPVAVLWHGRIITDNLPVEFTAPTDPTAFIFD